jgi:hypothetical protein
VSDFVNRCKFHASLLFILICNKGSITMADSKFQFDNVRFSRSAAEVSNGSLSLPCH